jgi:hypothetical protein
LRPSYNGIPHHLNSWAGLLLPQRGKKRRYGYRGRNFAKAAAAIASGVMPKWL